MLAILLLATRPHRNTGPPSLLMVQGVAGALGGVHASTGYVVGCPGLSPGSNPGSGWAKAHCGLPGEQTWHSALLSISRQLTAACTSWAHAAIVRASIGCPRKQESRSETCPGYKLALHTFVPTLLYPSSQCGHAWGHPAETTNRATARPGSYLAAAAPPPRGAARAAGVARMALTAPCR